MQKIRKLSARRTINKKQAVINMLFHLYNSLLSHSIWIHWSSRIQTTPVPIQQQDARDVPHVHEIRGVHLPLLRT